MTILEKIPLTGTDYFQLLLDRHMRKHGQIGNVVRLQLDFNGHLDPKQLRVALANSFFEILGSRKLNHNAFAIPYWKSVAATLPERVETHKNLTHDEFERKILNRDIIPGMDSLLYFDLVYFPNNKSSLVLSAHHVLADQRGILNLMKALDTGEISSSVRQEIKNPGWLTQLTDTFIATLFLLKSAPGPLAKLVNGKTGSSAKFRVIKFSAEETLTIDSNASAHGSKLIKSPFFLAATTISVNKILQSRKKKEVVYWIPVPQDQLLRGATGSRLSNHQSFLFFKISSVKLKDLRSATAFFSTQMKDQINRKIPARYFNLMSFFRRIPLGIYLKMVNLPTGGAMSSFSFSYLGESGMGRGSFMGMEVGDVLNYPPVPSPPGLSIVFMRFKGALRIVIGHVDEALNNEDMDRFEKVLRQTVLTENISEDV